ncbi:RNaseH domain-containing protein [Kitasatospora sp. NPDC101157]|uniref:RNaseH domain-containing protein n=1 Tax=Kitasatospora sp. NPDC101157 TaxID=3364098 RepID=UPI0037FE18F0
MTIAPFGEIQPLAFTVDPDAFPDRMLSTLTFPAAWMRLLHEQWQPRYHDQWMPTRALADLAAALDQAIVDVSTYGLDQPDRYWIAAERPVPSELLHHLVAAWATVNITRDRPHVDWYELLDPSATDGQWVERAVPIGRWDIRPNGTAAPVAGMFQILPSLLAAELTRSGLHLLADDQPQHPLVLGPTSHGAREAVEWPPRPMPDRDGPAPWSLGTRLAAQVAWQDPVPRVHLDLVLHRWLHLPLGWSPNKKLHVWLLAPDGLVRPSEEPTFLRAAATWRHGGWKWTGDLEELAGRLGQLPYPPLTGILADPAKYLSGGRRMAAVQYQSGMTLRRNSHDDSHGPKTIHHPVKPGFLPIDHRQVLEAVTKVLEPLGLQPVDAPRRRATAARSTSPRREPQNRSYALELWEQSPAWRDLLLKAVTDSEHGLGLTASAPAAGGSTAGPLRFSGDFDLSVALAEIGALAASLPLKPWEETKDRGLPEARRRRINEITKALRHRPHRQSDPPVGAIVEIDGPRAFSGKNVGDPKDTIRAGFAENHHITQFMLPVPGHDTTQPPETDFVTPDDVVEVVLTEDIENSEDESTDEHDPGTKDLMRAANSLRDALRQLGRLPELHPAPGGEEIEVWGIWLEMAKGSVVPTVIRVRPNGETTAQLPGQPELSYTELHLALAREQGRLDLDRTSDSTYIGFLRQVLIPDRPTGPRLLLVGGRNARSRGWPWLQTQHMRQDVLILPGADPDKSAHLDPHEAKATDPLDQLGIRRPEDCPGLRIVRIVERDAAREVPHVFSRDETRQQGMSQGLFRLHDRLYYGLAPKPIQGKGPIAVTKFDHATPRAARRRGWNTNALEIAPAFLQPGDDPAEWAMYVQSLRTAHLHTNVATRLPHPLHSADLAARYIQR